MPQSAQNNAQQQPSGAQGPQQGYPPPVPYYYPYPQNQFYGTPYNSGYGVPQPFVKYPTMFQPGPPAPGSAPSPAAKQPASVQAQSNPYSQSLYGQQHPTSAYDDIGYQHHTAQHNHNQSVSNLPSTDYGKHQLYGAHGGQSIQSFMGLGQSSVASSGAPLGSRAAGGASPEAAYKPYGQNVAMKDGGSGVGVGVSQSGVGQPQNSRGGVQQPHSQGGFYGTNRYNSNANPGPQAQQAQQHQPQNQGPQGHHGYAQGSNDQGFYSYQPRQQQGYWQ
ncbi:hypothetical protein SERLA73DRAFT_187967 [Serpula lacrymans var. lacrymans S7.3]|uniref:Uncharacterized protein n=1 Tax=Serpula lacrymans var. lacrymans (strain S7.3) TaxID=936435 RepID=F8Q9X9_SERL3|nr:hypothetical protein SERLA73DRAFT_187967 [Serpula lacrymans var. lacrymans S7.3]